MNLSHVTDGCYYGHMLNLEKLNFVVSYLLVLFLVNRLRVHNQVYELK